MEAFKDKIGVVSHLCKLKDQTSEFYSPEFDFDLRSNFTSGSAWPTGTLRGGLQCKDL